ncbi:unnamed protein product [Commensalibacter communis]|nr:unnamed protein product [Commensalibacter communis]
MPKAQEKFIVNAFAGEYYGLSQCKLFHRISL